MPKNVDIEIFNIGKTQVNREEVQRWMDYLGADEFKQPPEESVNDPAYLIALAGKRCYMSFQPGLNPNVSRIREDYIKYFDNILSSKHGSVLEHATYSFAVEGVSRVFTAEMNRHRAGWAISEGSLRFISFKEIPYWLPTSLQPNENDDDDLRERKEDSRFIFDNVFKFVESQYGALLITWDMKESHHNFQYKKAVTSCLRRIVPLGVATGGVWTGNIRALRHVMAMRADSITAEEEIYYVFCKIAEYMIQAEPLLFQDFTKNTENSWRPKFWKV